MLLRALLVSAAFIAGSSSAEAAVVAYRYFGQTLFLQDLYDPDPSLPTTLRPLSGLMLVNEADIPGGTLISATVTFNQAPGVEETPPGLLFIDLFDWPGAAGSSITFTTNAQREIVDWFADVDDDSPGIVSSAIRDIYDVPEEFRYASAQPGRWTTTVVPLPAGFYLGVTGMVLLFCAGRNRLSQAGPRALEADRVP